MFKLKKSKMKAYIAQQEDYSGTIIIFADSKRNAKLVAKGTDFLKDVGYDDIVVYRFPEADKQYRGNNEMDWNNPDDRLFLVKECGFYCSGMSYMCDCNNCIAKDYCEKETYEYGVSDFIKGIGDI